MEINIEDKTKFEKCHEHKQIGYLCDAYPTCSGCRYQISNEIFKILGGKFV